MATKEAKKLNTIRRGSSTLKYNCGGCKKLTEFPFHYEVSQSVYKYNGPCVDGDIEEWIKVTTDIPVLLQCENCGAVHKIGEPRTIYSNYSNPKGLSPSSKIKAEKNFGSKDDIDGDLEKSLEKIPMEFLGIPKKSSV